MGRPTYFLDLDAVVFGSFCHYKLIEGCYHGLKKDLHRTLISALLLQSVVSFLFIMADIEAQGDSVENPSETLLRTFF